MRPRIVQRRAQREREHGAGVFRIDDRVDESTGAGELCVQLMLIVASHRIHRLADRRSRSPARLSRSVERRSMHGLHGTASFHDRHAASGPGENEVWVEALAGHGIVPGTRSVVDRQDDLGNGRGGHRFNKSRAGTDNARMFGFRTYHKPRDVLHK